MRLETAAAHVADSVFDRQSAENGPATDTAFWRVRVSEDTCL